MLKYLIRKFDKWFLDGIDFGRIDEEDWWKTGDKWSKLNEVPLWVAKACQEVFDDFYIDADCAKGMSYKSILYPTRKKQSLEEIEKIIENTPE